MTTRPDIVLNLEKVSRHFPRDIADTPSSALREMLLPGRLLAMPKPDAFYAVRDVSFCLRKGQKLGIIGTHRSGKSILAGIASGVLHPTSGNITAIGRRLLIGRPTAGFRPTLSSLENLRLRASLAGLHGERLSNAVESTLSSCDFDSVKARLPMGNLSPFIVKQLGLTLLLALPADVLVVDELMSVGAGDNRWTTRAALQDRIASSTALLFSTDFDFLNEATKESMLLHQGLLFGPFPTPQAFQYYQRLPDSSDHDLVDSMDNVSGAGQLPAILGRILRGEPSNIVKYSARARIESPSDNPPINQEGLQRRALKMAGNTAAVVINIIVDGECYVRAKLRLLRRPGEILNIGIDILPNKTFVFDRIGLTLYAGTGAKVGNNLRNLSPVRCERGQLFKIRFRFTIPDLPRDHYGLVLHLVELGAATSVISHMKLVVFGLQTDKLSEPSLDLDVSDYVIDSNFDNKVHDRQHVQFDHAGLDDFQHDLFLDKASYPFSDTGLRH